MLAQPFLARELVGLRYFLHVAAAGPGIKVIAAITVGRHQHVKRALAMRVTVKFGYLNQGRGDRARIKQVAVGGAEGHALLAIIGGGRLWNQRVDVGELPSEWKEVRVNGHEMVGGENILEAGK